MKRVLRVKLLAAPLSAYTPQVPHSTHSIADRFSINLRLSLLGCDASTPGASGFNAVLMC